MIHLLLALSPFVAPAQEIDLDALLEGMTPEQLLARRVTPEHLVVQKAGPAVVFISTDAEVLEQDFWGQIFRRSMPLGSGSGALIRPEGFIVTNYHVVAGAQKIAVHLEESIDPSEYPAELVSYVAEEDLALLKIEARNGRPFPTIELGTSSDLMIGERVVAIGNPYGHAHTVSAGLISGLHRDVSIGSQIRGMPALHFDDLIQTDASINRGNSGGPLLNINGELIGINNAMNVQAENIGFAIPVDRIKAVLEEELISPDRNRAWLGFEIFEDDRLEIRDVVPGSPAALAGLEPGDHIVELDGQSLRQLDAYKLARVAIGPEEAVALGVRRGQRLMRMDVRPLEKADGLILQRLGVSVDHAYFGRTSFVRVAKVLEGGPAAEIGLRPGDLIQVVRVQGNAGRGQRIERRQDLAQVLAGCAPGSALEAYVNRDGAGWRGVLVTR